MPKLKCFALLGLFLFIAAGISACASQSSMVADGVPVALQEEGSPTPVVSSPETPEAETGEALPTEEAVDYCLDCHTDRQMLIDTASEEEEVADESSRGGAEEASQPPDPWQKVLVDAETFPTSIHGLNGCVGCHGGVQSPEKEIAHEGVISNPSKEPDPVCGECHPDIVTHSGDSLHSNLAGFRTALDARGSPGHSAELTAAFNDNCTSCHVTCGECHVSRPTNVGGGLVDGHFFNARPSMTGNCTACHADRVGAEYLGYNEGLQADVHFRQGEMECLDCHDGGEMHGLPTDCSQCHPGPENAVIPPPEHRYDGVQAPRCETCHPDVSSQQDGVLLHEMHGSKLSCQVCHSVEYTSCDGCHVGVDQETGEPYYEIGAEYLTFYIGRNTRQSYERPYEYVPVRHAPIAPDSFDFYGEDLLSNFDRLETWTYATPHNIQRNTPQTQSCAHCHGNPDVFLTADKVAPEELEANQDVIVDAPPPPITSRDQLP